MYDNNLYNLMNQCVQEHKSLWRIKDHYVKDASKEDDCKAFWEKMIKDKEDHIEKITALIKSHLS